MWKMFFDSFGWKPKSKTEAVVVGVISVVILVIMIVYIEQTVLWSLAILISLPAILLMWFLIGSTKNSLQVAMAKQTE